ncbi:MAG: PadR family transcriptional regulator [Actinomycetota bacterium]
MEDLPKVPTTTYAILGMLTFGEMSGYSLAKVVEHSVGYFWSPARSQIYSELRRLVSLGYAREREIAQQDRPDKRLYRITPRGERALRLWVQSPDVEPETFKSPFLLKVFFGGLAGRETLLAQVKESRRQAQETLRDLRVLEGQIKDQEELFYPYLTLKSGLAHHAATVRWADEVIKELEAREDA